MLLSTGCRRSPAPSHQLVLLARAPGLSAVDVERDVTIPTETALALLGAIETRSSEGLARVELRGYGDPLQLRAHALDLTRGLPFPPEPASSPVPEQEPYRYLLDTSSLTRTQAYALQSFELTLAAERVPGVLGVDSCGGSPEEVAVRVDDARLAALGVSLYDVWHAVLKPGDAGRSPVLAPPPVDALLQGALPLREGVLLKDVATRTLSPVPETCSVLLDGKAGVEGIVHLRDGLARGPLVDNVETSLSGHPVKRLAWLGSSGHVVTLRIACANAGCGVGVSDALRKHPEVRSVLVETRSGEDAVLDAPGELRVLCALEPRHGLLGGLLDSPPELDETLAEVARKAPGVRYVRTGATPVLRVVGEDLSQLREVGEQVVGALGVRAALVESQTTRLELKPDRAALARFGIPLSDFEETIHAALGGRVVAQAARENGQRVDVRVRLGALGAEDPARLGELGVPAPGGTRVPASQLMSVARELGPALIQRRDGHRFAEVVIDASPEAWHKAAEGARRALAAKVRLPPGYRVEIP